MTGLWWGLFGLQPRQPPADTVLSNVSTGVVHVNENPAKSMPAMLLASLDSKKVTKRKKSGRPVGQRQA